MGTWSLGHRIKQLRFSLRSKLLRKKVIMRVTGPVLLLCATLCATLINDENLETILKKYGDKENRKYFYLKCDDGNYLFISSWSDLKCKEKNYASSFFLWKNENGDLELTTGRSRGSVGLLQTHYGDRLWEIKAKVTGGDAKKRTPKITQDEQGKVSFAFEGKFIRRPSKTNAYFDIKDMSTENDAASKFTLEEKTRK